MLLYDSCRNAGRLWGSYRRNTAWTPGGIPCLHNHVRICLAQQTYQVMSMAHCWQHMLYAQLGLEVFEGTCPASISKSSRKDWKPFDWYCLFLHLRPRVSQLKCLFFSLFFDSCLDMSNSSFKFQASSKTMDTAAIHLTVMQLRVQRKHKERRSYIFIRHSSYSILLKTCGQGTCASSKGGATLNVGWLRVW